MLYDEHQIFLIDEFVLIGLVRQNRDVYQQDYYQNDLQELYE